ncbi:MAG: DUF4159 domain-containing protein [Proteobacteria bacterium]|nr:DUF4159 domain-containing protein [Pseudomonadota bacterium]
MFSTLFTGTAIVSLVSLVLWWIIRRRLKEIRFPIARVLTFPSVKMPRIIVKVPPIIPFLMFLLCTILLGLWMTKPAVKEFANHEPKESRVHVFVDMSPSVSAKINQLDLGRKVKTFWDSIKNASRITMSTSHNDTIYEISESDKAQSIISSLDFHRAGLKIGPALKQHLNQTGEIDRLIILSDRDQHSWSGFQWQFLTEETDVYWMNVDLDTEKLSSPNAFINRVKKIGSPASNMMQWEIDIAQGGINKYQEGVVKVSYNDETLASTAWKIVDGAKSTSVILSWSALKQAGLVPGDSIVWEILPQGPDAVLLDNIFRTPSVDGQRRSTIYAEPSGELQLEDHSTYLMTALSVLGLDTYRVDHVNPQQDVGSTAESGLYDASKQKLGPQADKLNILLGGIGNNFKSFCPKSIAKNVWLAPLIESPNYGELCQCLESLLSIKISCNAIEQRDQWIDELQQLGGKQIGGEIGQKETAVGWSYVVDLNEKTSSNRDIKPTSSQILSQVKKAPQSVIAMTIPLKPGKQFGISHGRFPKMIRELFISQNPTTSSGQSSAVASEEWIREADIAAFQVQSQTLSSDDSILGKSKLDLSNVPVAESLLSIENSAMLPPQWVDESTTKKQGQGKLDTEDPLPWIKYIIYLILAAGLFEIVANILKRPKSVQRNSILLLIAMMFLTSENTLMAQIKFLSIGSNSNVAGSYNRLSQEVQQRTSIDLSPKIENKSKFIENANTEGWMWVQSLDKIANEKGMIDTEVLRWIKRGGLLIIENSKLDDQMLSTFTSPFLKGTFGASTWRSVPQDHELMRSFYLLETLPSCTGKSWKWFPMDGRMAIVHIPYNFSKILQDSPEKPTCEGTGTNEYQIRSFVNLMMVALTTDYKRDQIHLPEILKRLRNP